MGFMDDMGAFAKGVGAKAKGGAEIASLKGKVMGLQKDIKDEYYAIGEKYFELNKDNPDPEFAENVDKIVQFMDQIEELNAMIEAKKEEI